MNNVNGLFKVLKRLAGHSLFRNSSRLTLLVMVSLLVVSGIRNIGLNEDMSILILQDMANRTQAEFQHFLAPVMMNLSLIQKWGKNGSIDLNNVTALNDRFIPIMNELPQVLGLRLFNSLGHEYILVPRENGWINYLYDQSHPELGTLSLTWGNKGKNLISKKKGLYHTYVPSDPFIMAIASWDVTGFFNVTYGVNLFVDLEALYRKSNELKLSKNLQVFLLNQEHNLFFKSKTHQVNNDSKSVINPMNEQVRIAIDVAVRGWKNQSTEADADTLQRFKSGDSYWWSDIRPLILGGKAFWVGVILPDSDLSIQIRKKEYFAIISFILAGALAFVFLLITFPGLRTHIHLIHHQSIGKDGQVNPQKDEKNVIPAMIAQGEHEQLEFKSSLRWNLKTNKADKNIEMAWLKTLCAFLNTQGGSILIGVADDGSIIGHEVDSFSNCDKYLLHFQHLFNQHVGLEFAEFVTFGLFDVYGKKVLKVQCDSSPKPVFLKNGSEEEFYIRVGPASRKLSISQVLKYIENRRSRVAG